MADNTIFDTSDVSATQGQNAEPRHTTEPPEPPYEATRDDKVRWLLETRGYFEAEDVVVRLYATSLDCRLKPHAFERRYRAWHDIIPPKGQRKQEVAFVTALGERLPHPKHPDGGRMRPDRPFPLYSEDDRLYKNIYRQPVHIAVGGITEPFLRFMERFLPNKTQREWFLDHMAHKQWKPWIPGQAVLFVADSDEGVREGTFGSGRGTLFKIAHKLYGEEYARPQNFDMLDGSSGQCSFTDWMHNRVLVTVNEAKTSATAYRKSERNAVYEVLKDKVDPAPQRMEFKVKHGQAFNDYCYVTYWVATNHSNALAIPRWDRRFTVLKNGRKMTPEEAKEINDWMEKPENIAALSLWLAARDLSNFNMLEPLDTDTKAEMAELGRTPVEDAMLDLMEDSGCGLVFIRPHLEDAIE